MNNDPSHNAPVKKTGARKRAKGTLVLPMKRLGTASQFLRHKKLLITIGIIAILLTGIAVGTRFNISVTSQEAMAIAIAHVGGGTSATPELDWETWRWLWWVEVWHDDLVHEVYVHPNTGAIIRHEIDRD